MRFPYVVFPARPDAAFPSRRSVARPVLPIALSKNGNQIISYAIVDSGADTCIFPASIALQLAITVPNQRTHVFSGTADGPQIAYFDSIRATIWNGDRNENPISFDLYAGFCGSLEHVGLGLLGQQGFFSIFKVSFSQRGAFFEVGSSET
jgi:hypothetical protein